MTDTGWGSGEMIFLLIFSFLFDFIFYVLKGRVKGFDTFAEFYCGASGKFAGQKNSGKGASRAFFDKRETPVEGRGW